MTGIPRHNFPAFAGAASALRRRGYDVVSPHELDAEKERAESWASPDGAMTDALWAECLARDVRLIAADGIQAIVVLPGWEQSRGAKLETFVARLHGLPILHYGPLDPLRVVVPRMLEHTHSLKEAA